MLVGLLVGFSSANITPGYGMEVPGGMSKRFTMGLHDDCLMTAAVFDDGAKVNWTYRIPLLDPTWPRVPAPFLALA